MRETKLLAITATLACSAFFAACSSVDAQNNKSECVKGASAMVNPMIGTADHGHTYPGATRPFSAVQASPDNGRHGWDWCSGYHYSVDSIMGFSQTHLSGTGCPDLGDILIMPTTGALKLNAGDAKNPDSGYRSRFSHAEETAQAGYYSVMLKDYNIKAEVTSTERAGFYRFTFPKSEQSRVLLDLTHLIGRANGVMMASARIIDDNTVAGSRIVKNWGPNREIYFAIQFSKPFSSFQFYENNRPRYFFPGEKFKPAARHVDGKDIKGAFDFDMKNGGQLLVKVGISTVSYSNALENIKAELPDWNFDNIVADSKAAWDKQISKISVKADKDTTTVFKTALYHATIAPQLNEDVNGEYRGYDHAVHTAKGFKNYTVFSLWDTFRALHPLMTIIETERTKDFVASMMAHFEQSPYKMLPIWTLPQNDTFCMVGYNSVPVVIDAWSKGLMPKNVSEKDLLAACVSTANQDSWKALGYYKKYGYIPHDLSHEGVSSALEYSYADSCIAYMAQKMGDKPVAEEFAKRGQNFKNHFEPETGFMRARFSDGKFREPFDPQISDRRKSKKDPSDRDYTEGNGWHWRWFAPQAPYELVNMIGKGKPEKFVEELDKLFTTERTDFSVLDVSGPIGEYAHGNEPSHHTAYFYMFANAPWKTQEMVRRIMRDFYTNKPDGICGNDDCGQMSAWYVLSAMGFYSFNPCGGIYVLGSPAVEEACINLESGKTFKIKAINQSPKNVYVKSVSLNGKRIKRAYITHSEIMAGGELVFEMSDKPVKDCFDNSIKIPYRQ